MTLTKSHLIDSIHKQVQLPPKKSADCIESILEEIKRPLETGDDVLISGFGKFCVKEKKRRRGRNPQTGEGLMLESRRIVRFKCSGVLRDKMNEKGK